MFCVHGYFKRGYVIDFFFFLTILLLYFLFYFFAHVEYFIRKKIYIFAEMTTGKPIIGGGFPNKGKPNKRPKLEVE